MRFNPESYTGLIAPVALSMLIVLYASLTSGKTAYILEIIAFIPLKPTKYFPVYEVFPLSMSSKAIESEHDTA